MWMLEKRMFPLEKRKEEMRKKKEKKKKKKSLGFYVSERITDPFRSMI